MGIFDRDYYEKKNAEEKARPKSSDDKKKPETVTLPFSENKSIGTDKPDQEAAFDQEDNRDLESYKPLPKKQSFADRLPNMHKVRKSKLRRQLTLIIGVSVAVILVTVYFLSPFSKLGFVHVTAPASLEESAIIKSSKLTLQGELWPQVFHKNATTQTILKSNPRIKNVTTAFEFPNGLAINVTEYKTKAYMLKDKVYYPVLENGVTLATSQNKPENNYPVLENFTEAKEILVVLSQYAQLSQELQKAISQIKATPQTNNRNQLTLTMNDGNTVIAQSSTLATNLTKYPQVATQMKEKGVVDIEAGIFSYPYPKPAAKTTDSETKTKESVQP